MHDLPDGSTTMHRALTWAMFLGAVGAVVYLGLSILHPFVGVIAWSAVLAIIGYPVHRRVVQRTRRVALSAFLTSMLIVLACGVPLLVLGTIAVHQGVALGQAMPGVLNRQARALSRVAAPAGWITTYLGLDDAAIPAWIHQQSSDLARSAGRYSVAIATGVLDAIMSTVLVICALFLLLRDGDRIVESIPALFPFERQRTEGLLRRITDVVRASVYGVVVIALLQGVLCGAMFWLLGVPSAALWGVVAMFASLLPVVGAFAVWGPATAYLAITGGWPRPIVLAIWGTFVVSGVDNVVRPRLIAERVGLSELAMLFAMLGGLSVFGGLGIVLGPVVFATATGIVDDLRARHDDESAAAPYTAAHQDIA